MNFPTGTKKTVKNITTYNNRGMSLESDINETNSYYLNNNIACIYKKPTPIQIVKVDYPSRNKAVIKEAYFKVPSTTDYNGVYEGKYIDFEAKETNTSYFPVSNIHEHQIEHLKVVEQMRGIGFLIIRFIKTNEVYILFINDLINFLNTNSRKSIPKEYFESHGYKLEYKYAPRLDYLKIIKEFL